MIDNKGVYKRYEIEWVGRDGLSPDTHEEYLVDFINHFYKNTLKLVDKAMKKEDSSEQGRIVNELMQHLHGCKSNCDVFFGRSVLSLYRSSYILRIFRTEELKQCEAYITGDSNKPFVMYGAGGSGKSSMLSKTAQKSVNDWTPGANPILFVRYLFSITEDIRICLLHQILWHYSKFSFTWAPSKVNLSTNILHLHVANGGYS